jgi:ribosomal protein S18 acetylase RimI-like enzyme
MVTPNLKVINIPDFIKLMEGGLAKSFETCIKDLRNQTRFTYTDILKESEKDKRDVRIALLISGNTVIFITRILKKGTTAEINMVYTNPKFRGKGYCKNILKKIIQKTRAVNFFLDVKKNNIPAINCYEKIGFVRSKISGSIIHMTYKKGSNTTRKKFKL